MNSSRSRRFLITAFIVSLFFFYASAASYAQSGDNLSYTVRIDKDQPKLAHVLVAFTPADSLLYMASGAQQFPKRWAHFIKGIKAVNAAGEPVILEETPDGQWIIQGPLNQELSLSYELQLDHEAHSWSGGIDGVAYANEWGVFYTGRSLFIMNGEARKNIEVSFKIPADWKVTSPWEPVSDTGKSFSINSLTELSLSMFFAGTHDEISVKRNDFELLFALGGEAIIDEKEHFKNMAEGVFDYYIELMGGTPKPPADNPFNKVVVIVNSAGQTDGEVVGNSISLLIKKDGDQMSEVIARFIFAHEFYHLWNGKSFFPENDRSEWFKEGVTNYYTLKALHHIGYLNDDSFYRC